jgi:AcrR family transcriptional regulator
VTLKEKDRILDLIERTFFENGFQKASIDFIASSIKMSKKTIYNYFRSKNELLLSLINRFISQINDEMEQFVNIDISVVEKIMLVSILLGKIGEKFTDKFITEVRILHPLIRQKIEEFRIQMINKNISEIFSQGINEGYIINIPPLIILTIY